MADASASTPLVNDAAGVVAGDMEVRIDDDGAFGNPAVSVTIFDADNDCDAAASLRDRAGNCAAVTFNFAVSQFAEPQFRLNTTADVFLDGGTCVAGDQDILNLHSDGGQACTAGETLTFTAHFEEAFGGAAADGLDDALDFALAVNGTAFEGNFTGAALPACVGMDTCTFSLSPAAGDVVRVNQTTGFVELGIGGADPLPLTFGLTPDDPDDQPSTAEGVALATATAVENTFTDLTHSDIADNSDTIAVTADQLTQANGVLDGFDLQLRHLIDTDLGANPGATVVDAIEVDGNGDRVVIPSSAVIVDGSDGADNDDPTDNMIGNTLRVLVDDEATLVAIQDDATDLDTDRQFGVGAPEIPYNASVPMDTTIVFQNIFDQTTGEQLPIPTIDMNVDILDNAPAILLTCTIFNSETGATGGANIDFGFSENLQASSGDPIDNNGFFIDDAPTDVIALQGGAALPLTTTISDDVVTIAGLPDIQVNVPAPVATVDQSDTRAGFSVVEDITGMNADAISVGDGVDCEDGGTNFLQPRIVKAFAFQNAEGVFDNILVQYDKVVVAAIPDGPGNGLDGLFTFTEPVANTTLAIDGEDITCTGNQCTLGIPGGGLNDLVNFIAGGANPVSGLVGYEGGQDDSDGDDTPDTGGENALQTTEADGTILFAANQNDFDPGCNDDDCAVEINGLGATTRIFTQQFTGTLSGVSDGDMVVATVVAESPVPTGGPNSVCTTRVNNLNVTTQLQLGNPPGEDDNDPSDPAELSFESNNVGNQQGIRAAMLRAIRAGEQRIDVSLLQVFSSSGGLSLHLVEKNAKDPLEDLSGGNEDSIRFPVELDLRTGNVTGSGVSGCRVEIATSLINVSDGLAMTVLDANDDGEASFNLLLGVTENLTRRAAGGNETFTGCIVASYQPVMVTGDNGPNSFIQLTSCDPAVGTPDVEGNFLPFQPDITNPSGVVEANLNGVGDDALGTLNPNDPLQLTQISIGDTNNFGEWEVEGATGIVRTTTNSTDFNVDEFFVCIDTDDGEPEIEFDDAGDVFSGFQGNMSDLDELFTLEANEIRHAIQINEAVTISTLDNDDVQGNFAFAYRQQSQDGDNTCSILRTSPPTPEDIGDGWSLGELGPECLLLETGPQVTGLIVAGSGQVPFVATDLDEINAFLASNPNQDAAGNTTAFFFLPDDQDDFTFCGAL